MNKSGQVQMSGDMIMAIKTCGERAWTDLFKALKEQKSMQVISCNGTDALIKLQASVLALSEMEQFFLAEMRRE